MLLCIGPTLVARTLLSAALVSGYAGAREVPVLDALPDKTVCKAVPLPVGKDTLELALCVALASSGSDAYFLKENDAVLLQGTDDQVRAGVRTLREKMPLTLRCTPLTVMPNTTAGNVKRLVPGLSADEAREIARLMYATHAPMEIGRGCKITLGRKAGTMVQVLY